MKDGMTYHCEECGKYAKGADQSGIVPECCGKKMKQLPLSECIKDPGFAEHARFDDDDTPCDPGTSGGP